LLHDACTVADGLKLAFERSGDVIIQNMYYNGWMHSHCVTNLFVFAPDGLIGACIINVPGSVHDSTMAEISGIYTLLNENYARNG